MKVKLVPCNVTLRDLVLKEDGLQLRNGRKQLLHLLRSFGPDRQRLVEMADQTCAILGKDQMRNQRRGVFGTRPKPHGRTTTPMQWKGGAMARRAGGVLGAVIRKRAGWQQGSYEIGWGSRGAGKARR
ncbi:uncharacterized protein VTP21DRAFT_3240 [Calcarisporiella thermophila]|uniref:uncharacterized protein n=1 Tax=Calcarisporiella thermophila TaxID=911321 RepID=UPI003742740E